MSYQNLTASQKARYDSDGYLIIPDFLTRTEVDLLYNLATNDDILRNNAFDLNDQSGKRTKLTLWFTPGNDTFSLLTRSERMVRSVQSLLGDGKVCHFHSKLMQKEPKVGGAWEWHQDYGYWYKNGFLYPDALISVMLALTEATKENGCLQVLKGSHKMGRFEHLFAGEQQGADMPFVEEALKICKKIYVELKAGDVLFFHPNLLHMSEANLSDKPRWSLISAYNLSYNKPFREKNTSCITPVSMVPDNAIMESAPTGLSAQSDFLNKENEITLKVK
ncbi:phytanoyl-CoA dioxygenase family protein [Mucilaginibacter sabulilitoris]|uniref:Phytanoyl-CoA dioxygenase family protein n=1 Tax=Mucilaginibacter sabulilitoris TaxID=1173583 RepID=A0ABZ0TZU2_9SPHI|nr:phytanoyl-CoA dioxygenase family protein [Mucilaginibacter sabulilitoris]WPU97055.1 phytanoyl-CoA dioxygenase family protein [Mucilaginibacter sabulilitoris]